VPIKYSPTEAALLELLPANGDHITMKELTEKHYQKQKKPVPWNGQIAVANSVRNLAAKAMRNRERFRVRRSKKIGPHGIEAWIEKLR
jgi:hypothetical protein